MAELVRRATAAVLPLLALAACSGSGEGNEGGEAVGEPVNCAIAGATQLAPTCRVERQVIDGELYLTVHHEDGGFRRLKVMDDGTGVSAADGADQARITVFDGEIEVAVGADRYILPATITDAEGPDAGQ